MNLSQRFVVSEDAELFLAMLLGRVFKCFAREVRPKSNASDNANLLDVTVNGKWRRFVCVFAMQSAVLRQWQDGELIDCR
ncbi:hypothetical protein TW80_16510 [Loktanella sp. S4079]|nr:hypothetical protein TW80_16510 [Loktanella sp. S4079]